MHTVVVQWYLMALRSVMYLKPKTASSAAVEDGH